MDSWPISLQQKLNADSFQMKYGKTALRTDMEVGPAKVRSRFTDAVDLYTCSVLLDMTEKTTFDTFFKTTLNNGINSFLFNDPFTGSPATFRFSDEPTLRPLGGLTFQLSMAWEKLA